MNVFIFSYLFPPEYTGASIQAITLAKELRKNGVNVTFVTATLEDEYHDTDKHDGFPVIRITPNKNSSKFVSLFY